MQTIDNHYSVRVELAFTVEADGPDSAVRAVLPLLPKADEVRYSIQSSHGVAAVASESPAADLHANLTKSAYKANEVAQLLGISRHAVYERVPCIRVGSRRLYPRNAIIEVLQHGFKAAEPVLRPALQKSRVAIANRASVVREREAVPRERTASPFIKMKEAAVMLGLSASKCRELFDSGRIYYVEDFGKRKLLRDAVEHFLRGGTPSQYVEHLIGMHRDKWVEEDPETFERVSAEMRARWKD